jgi:hypothetical protein
MRPTACAWDMPHNLANASPGGLQPVTHCREQLQSMHWLALNEMNEV